MILSIIVNLKTESLDLFDYLKYFNHINDIS